MGRVFKLITKEISFTSNINETVKLSDVNLENVIGGAYGYAGKHAVDKNHKWELINDETGETEGSFATKKQVLYEAKLLGYKTDRYYLKSTVDHKRDALKQHSKLASTVRSRQTKNWVNPF